MQDNKELTEAVEILKYISNLDDREEANEFVRLWIKSVNNSLGAINESILDERKIINHIHDVDTRISLNE